MEAVIHTCQAFVHKSAHGGLGTPVLALVAHSSCDHCPERCGLFRALAASDSAVLCATVAFLPFWAIFCGISFRTPKSPTGSYTHLVRSPRLRLSIELKRSFTRLRLFCRMHVTSRNECSVAFPLIMGFRTYPKMKYAT
jgi:hypothetical protein